VAEIFDDKLSIKNPPRPQTPDEIQFEVVDFDVFSGEGEWHIYRLPDEVREYTNYSEFELVATKLMSTSKHFSNPFKQSHTLDYLHNTGVLTLNLITGEMFNPFLEELNRRTRGQSVREVASGIIES
jgi:hypothetical protein